MKILEVFQWDNDDPIDHGNYIQQAFNRCVNFAPEIRDDARTPEKVAYNRITVNREFHWGDMCLLSDYSKEVFDRISERCEREQTELAPSLLQAAENLLDTLETAKRYVIKTAGWTGVSLV